MMLKCKIYLTFWRVCAILADVKSTLQIYGGETLENNIKDLRKQKGITQDELAMSLGVTRQTIISLENGRYTASLQLAFKISKFFGKAVEEIFVYEEE